MTNFIKNAALIACVAGVLASMTSCAEEHLNITPSTLTNVDTVVIEKNLDYERLLQFDKEHQANQGHARVNFNQLSRIIGSYNGTPEIDVMLNPTANVEIKLEKDTITVDDFFTPELTSTNISEVTSTTDEFSKTNASSFTGIDELNDGQVVNFDAKWAYSYLQAKSENVDFAHVEINDVVLASVDTEMVEELTMKVMLNYDVEYKTVGTATGEYSELVRVSPYYFQKVEEVVDEVGEPYYVCEPNYTYDDNGVNCKFIVNKITPHTLAEDEVEKIAQRTLKIATIGRPGDETLYVFTTNMSSNNYTTSDATITTGAKNGFSWTETKTEHNFRAEWNSNGLEVGHTDKIMLYEVDVKYQDENCEFNFDYTAELKVVKNEVIVEDNVTTEGYIGTRVLTIEGYLNGEKFAEFTGKTTLLQHS